jgi:hypothetical protein
MPDDSVLGIWFMTPLLSILLMLPELMPELMPDELSLWVREFLGDIICIDFFVGN